MSHPYTQLHEPGQSWPEIYKKMNSTIFADGTKLKDKWDNKAYPFRVFKSHGMWCKHFPACEIVWMLSNMNGKDRADRLMAFSSRFHATPLAMHRGTG